MNKTKGLLFSLLLVIISVSIAAAAAEIILRLKNSSMTTYDIEMWRYSNELKVRVDDPDLGFDHVKDKSALLQNVLIRLNGMGLRGATLQKAAPNERRILFLGGSITLGWGVPEDETVTARLEQMLRQQGEQASVLNGGVGNYNTVRYVSRFFRELTPVQPTDIVVNYFLRDAEDLQVEDGNFLLRNSELAVTLWIAYHRLFDRAGEASLVEHYRKVYDPDAPGFQRMVAMLQKLSDYAKEHGIRLYMLMTPDIHNLVDYKFGFVHAAMEKVAKEAGYVYVDALPIMLGRPPQDLFAMPGDPHPNALGHRLMAETIFPVIARKNAAMKIQQ